MTVIKPSRLRFAWRVFLAVTAFASVAPAFAQTTVIDISPSGGRAEAGALVLSGQPAANTGGTNFGPSSIGGGLTLTINNQNRSGGTTGGIDWRDRGDGSGDSLVALGEDFVKNNSGIVRVTLSGLAAGDYNVTSYHVDPDFDQCGAIEVWVDDDGNGSFVDTGARGDASINVGGAGGLTTAEADSTAAAFSVTSNGADPVVIVFDGIDATDTEVPLSGLRIELATPVDSDNDNLPDAWEELHFGVGNLSQSDTDDWEPDGLNNFDEYKEGTNPKVSDSDGDGIDDGPEFHQYTTDPDDSDTDDDGLEDGEEINHPTDATDPKDADSDNDGLNDGAELNHPTDATDPNKPDSDDDGFNDGLEIALGSDPNDKTSTPDVTTLDDVVINEFQAQNSDTLSDEDGDTPDWIELWNPNAVAVPIDGWHLTDDPANLTKWTFPATTLGANGFLVVFASGKDRTVAGAELHTDFSLEKNGGFLALTRPDGAGGTEIVHQYNLYGEQHDDVSFGLFGSTPPLPSGYFTNPTPDAVNDASAVQGFVADTTFTVDRGIYDTPFTTTLSCATPGATLIYTTDGTLPSASNGTQIPPTDAETPPTAAIPINATTTLRAMATKANFEPTDVDTQSYIFPASVLLQSNATVPAHVSWGHAGPDYEMDPQIVGHSDPDVKPVTDDFKRAPIVSLVMNWNEIFGSGGIYPSGQSVEKLCSVEYINPDGDVVAPNDKNGFQVEATVQIVGGTSTNRWKSDKLSMRLKFGSGGFVGSDGKPMPDLIYDVFGKSRAGRFDTLVLDNRLNNVWHYGPNNTQRNRGQYTHDQFPADLQTLMGGLSPEGKHVLLFINGVFWGISELHERPDDNFAAEYLGGDNDDYDVIKHTSNTVVNGSSANYNAMLNLSRQNMAVQANYQAVADVLHIENFIAYMIANYYVGNTDWAHHNWYASYNKVDPAGKWYYHSWDPEHCMENTNENVTGKDNTGGPTEVFRNLIDNPEFKLLFADRVHRHFHNDGVLTPANAAEAYMRRANDVDLLTRLESARWGDNRESNPYTRLDWLETRDELLGTVASSETFQDYFPLRTGIVLNQFDTNGWYPDTDPPAFAQHGGNVPSGYELGITSPDGGTIYYTLDGSDPRTPASTPQLLEYELVAEGATKRGMQPVDDSLTATWFGETFDDSSWATGTLGAGYDNGKYDYLIDPAFDMSGATTSTEFETFYLRWEFELSDPSGLDTLTLGARYDDGYVAYLNGTEIARVNHNGPVGTPLPYDAPATSGQTDETSAQQFDALDVSQHLGLLKSGTNVLAVHGLNSTSGSSDMLIDATLHATDSTGGGPAGISPTAKIYSGEVPLSTTGPVRARVRSAGGEWSALTDAVFVVGTVPADADNLVISEIHYRPAAASASEIDAGFGDRADFEFVELLNVGTDPVDLTDLDFTAGIDFVFADHSSIAHLDPGARLVIVADADAFAERYPGSYPIAGEFQNDTNLSNGGETLTLINHSLAAGMQTVASVTYADDAPWPTAPDGDGYSLTLGCADSALDHNDPAYWRASVAIGGSPGSGDGESLTDWLTANGLSAGQETSDFDFDGLAAIVEFAQGTDPNSAASSAGISTKIETLSVDGVVGDYQVIEFQRRKGADGVSVDAEVSGDLVDWLPAGPVVAFRDAATPGIEILTIRAPEPMSSSSMEFLRLRVEVK